MSLAKFSTTAGLVVLSAGAVSAAGIERTATSSRVLFEEGRYAEFSLGYVRPDLKAESGNPDSNIFNSLIGAGAAWKDDINDQFSYAIIVSTPWGVDTEYPNGAPYTGVTANLDTIDLTAILAYDINPSFKIYGGLRAQSLEAKADIPFVADYSIKADRDIGFGYMLGGAYQRPNIALRVSLTYYSAIEHSLDTTESSLAPLPTDTTTDVTTPQAVHLEFQTGIMEDTLLFGSVRWVDWSEFRIDPPSYPLDVPLVDYEEDWTTYMLGVARRFDDTWSGSLQFAYEPPSDTVLTTLGPVDGRKTLTAGVVYSRDNMKITGGLSYSMLGKAENIVGTEFDNGSAWGAGLRIGFSL